MCSVFRYLSSIYSDILLPNLAKGEYVVCQTYARSKACMFVSGKHNSLNVSYARKSKSDGTF